jgi:hypothetical protein
MKINSEFNNKIFGIILIQLSIIIFVIFTIWIIISKLIDLDQIINQYELHVDSLTIKILKFMQNDEIICVSIPLLFPILIVISYAKWTAFNYFKYSN